MKKIRQSLFRQRDCLCIPDSRSARWGAGGDDRVSDGHDEGKLSVCSDGSRIQVWRAEMHV